MLGGLLLPGLGSLAELCGAAGLGLPEPVASLAFGSLMSVRSPVYV